MTLKYPLLAGDYLQYYLFTASQNKQIKRTRNKTWLMLGIALLLIGVVTYQGNKLFAVILLIVSVPGMFLFPFYLKHRYYNICRRMAAKKNIDKDAEVSTLIIDENSITTFDSQNNFNFDMAQLTKISEVRGYIFMHLKSGIDILIPLQKIEPQDELRSELKVIAEQRNVPYDYLPGWKW